jgi:hypothetical protein
VVDERITSTDSDTGIRRILTNRNNDTTENWVYLNKYKEEWKRSVKK